MTILWVVRASSVSAGRPLSRLPVWGTTAHHTVATVCASAGTCPSSSRSSPGPRTLMTPLWRSFEVRWSKYASIYSPPSPPSPEGTEEVSGSDTDGSRFVEYMSRIWITVGFWVLYCWVICRFSYISAPTASTA